MKGIKGIKTISIERAKHLCSIWNNGCNTSLFQFASTGNWVLDNHTRYLSEIESKVETVKFQGEKSDLKLLKRYFSLMLRSHQSLHTDRTLDNPVLGYIPRNSNLSIKYPVQD